MKSKENRPENPHRRLNRLSTREKLAAVTLAGASLIGAVLLLADKAGDSDNSPEKTTTTTETTIPELSATTRPPISSTEATVLENPPIVERTVEEIAPENG